MIDIELINTVKKRVLERIISVSPSMPGSDLSEVKLDVITIRKTLYDECDKIARESLEEDLKDGR